LPGSIKRLIDALDVPLPNGPLDIRPRALAQADLVEPIGRAGENLLRWAVFWIRSRQTLSGRGRSGMSLLLLHGCRHHQVQIHGRRHHQVQNHGHRMLSIDVHCPYLCQRHHHHYSLDKFNITEFFQTKTERI
jgi:hypothetical protein